FSARSLAAAFGLAGFHVETVRHNFAGQYLWLQGDCSPAKDDGGSSLNDRQQKDFLSLVRKFAKSEPNRIKAWNRMVDHLAQNGRLAVWGAGAKGVTFANLVDPNCQNIAFIVDMNPQKQGKYLAGTGHGIVAPDELMSYGVKNVLVLNPNYFGEISE